MMRNKKRKSKEIEDKINNLKPEVKSTIHTMKGMGIPEDVIADRIQFDAGSKNTAKRIVQSIGDEPKFDSKKASMGVNANKKNGLQSKTKPGRDEYGRRSDSSAKAQKERDKYFNKKKSKKDTQDKIKGAESFRRKEKIAKNKQNSFKREF